MTGRPCIDCGIPTEGTRCAACQPARQAAIDKRRGSPYRRGYNSQWRKVSRAARRLQPWCTECGALEDLTADHVVPRARGGSNVAANAVVLCRTCNGRKGAR